MERFFATCISRYLGGAVGANAFVLFDLHDSTGFYVDEEGMEFRDVGAAQQEAAHALADMARDAVRANTGELTERMSVEVRDDAGPVLHVKFFFEIERKN